MKVYHSPPSSFKDLPPLIAVLLFSLWTTSGDVFEVRKGVVQAMLDHGSRVRFADENPSSRTSCLRCIGAGVTVEAL